jgi:hypothetical protein
VLASYANFLLDEPPHRLLVPEQPILSAVQTMTYVGFRTEFLMMHA